MSPLIRSAIIGGAACAAAVIGFPAIASAISPPEAHTATIATADAPPLAAEDFSYPNAAKILSEKGIKLIKGDGHLLLDDCNTAIPQIRVRTVSDATTGRSGLYCFKATGKAGFVTLELPRVTSLETTDHPISADLTAEGQTKTIDVPQDDFKPVGEGDIPSGAKRSVLVSLRVTG